jgi:hypothetical protein
LICANFEGASLPEYNQVYQTPDNLQTHLIRYLDLDSPRS